MSRKSFIAALGVAAFAAPALAAGPQGWVASSPAELKALGHLAWVSRQDVAPSRHACCEVAVSANRVVVSPAEVKALGHVGWVSREGDPVARPTCRRIAYRPARFDSPAERKALGHIAARNTAEEPRPAAGCCNTGRCPMRPNAVASR